MHALVALALALAPLPVADPPVHDDAPAEAELAPVSTPEPALDAATLFRVGRYREAADAFAREYESDPDPALLFGRAAAFKRSGDCLSAIGAFRAFIDAGPPAPDVEEAERQIAECEAIVEATARAANEQAAAPVYGAPPHPPSPMLDDERPRARWSRDPIGGTLVGTGAAVLLAGAGLYGAAFGVADRAPPDAHSEHAARERQVRSLAGTGIPLMVVGAALVVGGIVRWAVLARKGRRFAPTTDHSRSR